MQDYKQLELFNLEDYISPKTVSHSDLLVFRSRPKTVYVQLELDLGLDVDRDEEAQFSEPKEAA